MLVSLLIAMGATAGSAAAASCQPADGQAACENGEPAGPSVDTSQAEAAGRITKMFGVKFRLVLLSGTGCPAALGHSAYACVEHTAAPPIVYMRDGLDRYTRRYALRHEVGHIVCWRTRANTSERCADRWAKAHMPKKKQRKR